MRAVSCLSDPVLRASLSPPFDGTPEDLCRSERAWQFYMMCPPEMIEAWAPVIQAIFTAAMTIKSRKPQAPRQTWIIDEAGQLKGYDHIARMFTYGAGSGIRPVAVFQHARQMRQLGPDADQIIASSAGLQITFGVRDIDTAKRVSDMLGSETLFYDDPLHQGRADVEARSLFGAVMNGADPFTCVAAYHQKTYETVHLSKQHRKLRTPDEVVSMPGDRMVLVVDGLPGPVYAARAPYWTCPWMAGRYHPNPFHPPMDRVLVTTERGSSWRPVITQTVPTAFAQYPQYRGGTWSYIGA